VKTLAEKQLSTRAPGKGIDVLMGIAGAKTAENHFPMISPVISIGICKKDEVLTLTNIDSSIP
tara:strand:+ start:353 stop:541 length:189 start_codon:yes stop_codon:yes gene_type:complete